MPVKSRYSPPTADRKETIEIGHREIAEYGLLCRDCGVDTIEADKYYIVAIHLWDIAWRGYERKPRGGRLPGDDILCLVCLQKRIGRAVELSDFTAVVPSLRGLRRARQAWEGRQRSMTTLN
jgi:hypothetical protein